MRPNRARNVKGASRQLDHEWFEGCVLAEIMVSDFLVSASEAEPAETLETLALWALGYTHAEIADLYGEGRIGSSIKDLPRAQEVLRDRHTK